MDLWDEFSPSLYTFEVELKTQEGTDSYSSKFGMRKVEQGEHHVRLNNRDIHMRGVLDCAVFPLTGYPSTNSADWKKMGYQTVAGFDFELHAVRSFSTKYNSS